jgi:hypothetical protein
MVSLNSSGRMSSRFCSVGADGGQRRREVVQPEPVRRARRSRGDHLLVVDGLHSRRPAAAAVLDRPVDAGESRSRLLAFPLTAQREGLVGIQRRPESWPVPFRVDGAVQVAAKLAAELLLRRAEGDVHACSSWSRPNPDADDRLR